MKQTGVRLPEELIKQIKKACIDKGISFQEAIRIAAEEWLAKSKNE